MKSTLRQILCAPLEVAADLRRSLGVREAVLLGDALGDICRPAPHHVRPGVRLLALSAAALVVGLPVFSTGFGAIQPEPYSARPMFAVFIARQ